MKRLLAALVGLSLVVAAAQSQVATQIVNSIVATTCSSQFVRSISATGAATCASIANADLTSIRGQFPGTNTNDNASAGNIGEIVYSEVVDTSAVSVSSETATTITSITVTAGDWDVYATGRFTGNTSTTVNYLLACISNTTNTLDASPVSSLSAIKYATETIFNPLNGNVGPGVSVGPVRVSVSGSTTLYLVVQTQHGVSTLSGFGFIYARRAR